MDKQKLDSDIQREVATLIAIQKIGITSVDDIKEKIEKFGAKLTTKQIEKACKNLQSKGFISVDISEQQNGISVIRYKIKRVSYGIPEIAQIKSFIDSKEAQPLIDELDKAKGSKKQSVVSNYYHVDVTFEVLDKVLGFISGNNGETIHYRDSNNEVMFLPVHFRRWLQNNMRLVNKHPAVADKIQVNYGTVEKPKFGKEQNTIININNSFKGGGRGIKIYETLEKGTIIKTFFTIPADEFSPEDFKKVLIIFCATPIAGFGAYAKRGYGHLNLKTFEVGKFIW